MKSIERRFNNTVAKNSHWSSYFCFAEAIKGQDFSKRIMHCWFNKLVDKNDYAKSDKRAILTHLDVLAKCTEDSLKRGQISSP